jgi:hypothetical protein
MANMGVPTPNFEQTVCLVTRREWWDSAAVFHPCFFVSFVYCAVSVPLYFMDYVYNPYSDTLLPRLFQNFGFERATYIYFFRLVA